MNQVYSNKKTTALETTPGWGPSRMSVGKTFEIAGTRFLQMPNLQCQSTEIKYYTDVQTKLNYQDGLQELTDLFLNNSGHW